MYEEEIAYLRENVVAESATRYLFESKRQKGCVHLVDLEANDLNGECSCQHYQYRVAPMIKQGLLKPDSEKARCKHIRVARQLFYEITIKAISGNTK